MEPLQINSITEYVLGDLTNTMAVDTEAGFVTVKFFYPHIPSSAFTFPDPQDVLDVDISISDITYPGQPNHYNFTLSRKEMSEATSILSKRL